MKPTFKKPNIKGPRFRNKAERIIDQDFYVKLTKMYPDLVISRKDVKKILNTFHLLCTEVIAETRDGLELLEQLGNIIVGKFKTQDFWKGDIQKCFEYQTKIDYLNWESNEWVCKIFYSNFANKYRFKNAALWGFESCKPLKKAVSKAFTKDPHKYIFADNYNRINKTFRLANKELKEKLRIEYLNKKNQESSNESE